MKKYVLVGTGSRATTAYIQPICNKYKNTATICGIFDIDTKRAHASSALSGSCIKVFDDFDRMLAEVVPDAVIITCTDAVHDEYIVRSLMAGYDVICEKPITTTPEKLKCILNAEINSNHKVIVTFNCRYMHPFEKIKEILMSGRLGDICSVHYEWMLDRNHGASYFRRWHRERKNSGSLLIHKSTHHFDLLNWFLDDEPEYVNSFGTRRVYGNTVRMKNDRCYNCPDSNNCEYYYNITEDKMDKALYFDCEDCHGYIRDKCVFSDEIDIEDNVCVNIKHKKGCVTSYTLNAHSPYEGVKIVFNGTKGRGEFSAIHSGGIYGGTKGNTFILYFPDGEIQTIQIPDGHGDHGGADTKMLYVLIHGSKSDHLGQAADTKAGAMAAAIGMAANISMKESRQVKICEIIE